MIRFSRVTKRYDAEIAVDDLQLEIAAGEIVALIGPNGSGKTTTLKMAAGLLTPTSGEVLVGNPGRRATDPSARSALSFLPQRVAFPEALTALEVVDFYRRLRGTGPELRDDVLRFASLNGASTRPVSTYSGGMVQRLGLAVALVADAPALLLDEPSAALDPAGLSAFYETLAIHRRRGRTVLFSSHQIGDVEQLADRFAVLVEGRLVASLTRRELADALEGRGRMRLTIAGDGAAALAVARGCAPGAALDGGDLVIPGAPTVRTGVLDALRSEGVEIVSLTTEEAGLDDLYRELVSEAARGRDAR